MTDIDLIVRRARQGDDDAFEQLVLRYEKLVYHIAMGYFQDAEDARDMAQEALIKAYKNIRSFHGTSFKSWLCAITVHTCIDEYRRRKKKHTVPLDENILETAAGGERSTHEPTPEEAFLHKEGMHELLSVIQELPDDLKTMIILRDMQQLRYEELADITGLKLGTVKSRLSRARNTLMKRLREQK